MATLSKSIFIQAPVEKVFAFMDNPTNMLQIWPSMVDVRNVKDPGDGRKTYDWTYKMAGMKFDGSSEDTEMVRNERVVTMSKGGIDSKFTWEFVPENGGTRVDVKVDYKVPVPVLGKLAEGVIIKQNEREMETLLANLKSVMEVPEKV
jgi:carbon monoxide dehydrogenase subunit G